MGREINVRIPNRLKDEVNINKDEKYGGIEDNSILTNNLMDVLKQSKGFINLSKVHEEVLHMIMHKISRMVCGDCNYVDNATDIAGYATRLEEYIIKGKETINLEGIYKKLGSKDDPSKSAKDRFYNLKTLISEEGLVPDINFICERLELSKPSDAIYMDLYSRLVNIYKERLNKT